MSLQGLGALPSISTMSSFVVWRDWRCKGTNDRRWALISMRLVQVYAERCNIIHGVPAAEKLKKNRKGHPEVN